MYFRSMKSHTRFVLDRKESDSACTKRSPVIIIGVDGGGAAAAAVDTS